jgi:hydrogenase maturation protein HypF
LSRKIEARINITGRVQGVGFRPFIYRMAARNGLLGYVINLGDAGVEIIVEGTEDAVSRFLKDVRENAPEVSDIEDLFHSFSPFMGRFDRFIIHKSKISDKVASGIYPPDIGICPECLRDMDDPNGRWFEYPFTACAWCGPRFTSVKALPYDRERTHMHNFPMCKHCEKDYYDPLDRRFDAQGITCHICGPKMSLHNASGEIIDSRELFTETAKLLMEGNIVAVKGIGGIHLVSLATQDDVLEEFRRRKDRKNQPYALMSPDLTSIRSFALVDKLEERHLRDWKRPVVILRKRYGVISDLVAPGLNTVGVMLPYTGIQTMLFKRLNEPALVMTSGNRRGLPMVITNEAAFDELGGLADYFLLHNRDIINRSDDSVLRIIHGKTAFTRRSRGYVPDPIDIPIRKGSGIALGAELRNAAAIGINGKAFMTQYLGDITSLEGVESERKAVQSMRDLLNITCNPDVMACDLHPSYMTSQIAEVMSQEMEVPLVKSQHHHAHITSVMAENGIKDEEVLGISLDGAGYGDDGQIWGGEVLKSTYLDYKRVGQLEYIPMPGGDLCAYYPYRMLISSLSKRVSDDEVRDITLNHIDLALPYGSQERDIILNHARREGVLMTSSAGRFLDSVSALIGTSLNRTYEGEPAMLLEDIATKGNPDSIKYEPDIQLIDDKYVLNTSNVLYNLLINRNKHKKEDIAAYSQKYLAYGLTDIVKMLQDSTGITKVALSGGVFVNNYITSTISKRLENEGFTVLRNTEVPPGDGGVALGQLVNSLHHVI